jgi:hypothetical protein
VGLVSLTVFPAVRKGLVFLLEHVKRPITVDLVSLTLFLGAKTRLGSPLRTSKEASLTVFPEKRTPLGFLLRTH